MAELNPNDLHDTNNTSNDQDDEEDDDAASRDSSRQDDDDDDDGLSLRQTAASACKRIDIGAAVLPKPLFTPDVEDYGGSEALEDIAATIETPYARILRQEFSAIVVEHHLKWAPLCVSEPGPLPGETTSDRLGRYDFYHADTVVDWALAHDIKVKGHVLVWHVTSPKLLEHMEAAQVRTELRRHIFTVMGHFRGRIQLWDVVNEALAPDGSLADNVFLRKLGPSYIEDSFRWAHEADPSATLLYNDNKVEGIGTPKSDAFYNLLADLKAKCVPVHGCGIQAHFNAAGTGRNRPPTPRMVKAQIHRLGDLGLTVNISEMDVRVSQLPAEIRQQAQCEIYHDILAAALSEAAFNGIWLWGFTDRHTWVSNFYYDDEPLVFDEDYRRKQAYYALRKALATLSTGGCVGGSALNLDSDFDANGYPWGHAWMRPESTGSSAEKIGGGDARPDWEQAVQAEPVQSEIDTSASWEEALQDGGGEVKPPVQRVVLNHSASWEEAIQVEPTTTTPSIRSALSGSEPSTKDDDDDDDGPRGVIT